MGDIEAIVITRQTAASPAVAWRALTDPAEVTKWLTDSIPVRSVGSPFRLDFGDSAIVGVIVHLEPQRSFGYTWAWEGQQPVQVTRVMWSVEQAAGGGALVTLRHDGWDAAGADVRTRDDHAEYWEDYLDQLAELLNFD